MRLLSGFLFGLFALISVSLPGIAQPVDGGHARVELVSERALAVPGEITDSLEKLPFSSLPLSTTARSARG